MIKATNIYRSFGDVHILKGVSLDVKSGEIISIMGASGAGKSTFLQILGTLDNADQGEITYSDIDVLKLKDKELSKFRNTNIGFVFQFHHLLPEFTALENVCIPGYIAKKNPAEVQAKGKELLEILNLSHRLNAKPSTLSGGEQQRVAVARSLINSPQVVLADEPSGNLDSKGATELHQLFLDLRKELNQTFVIVTHNKELAALADRQLLMVDGKFEAE
jgi:lipoprotein-releasing system ATP-binding protein